MITDPNYVTPPGLTERLNIIPIESARMVIRELSGSDGDKPTSVADQVTMQIEHSINHNSDNPWLVY